MRKKTAGRKRWQDQSGVTLIEFMVAIVLSGLVALAAGFIYLTSERSFRQGRDKLLTQQNAAWCLEEMSRDLRVAGRTELLNASHAVLYDAAGNNFATWKLGSEGGLNRVMRNDEPVVPEECTLLEFGYWNADSSTVFLNFELADEGINRVRMDSRVTLRNKRIRVLPVP